MMPNGPEDVLYQILKWNIQAYYSLYGFLSGLPEGHVRDNRMELCKVGVSQSMAFIKVMQSCAIVPIDSDPAVVYQLESGVLKDVLELEKLWKLSQEGENYGPKSPETKADQRGIRLGDRPHDPPESSGWTDEEPR